MTPHFENVALIGVGLLGGSLGLALKKHGVAGHIAGIGHRKTSLDAALAKGAIDTAYLEPREPITNADLIVICTPAAQVTEYLDQIRPICRSTATVTDVASTKSLICRHAAETWPKPLKFIGSHPMAGSEKFGVQHARADLYEGCIVLVEEGAHLDEEAGRLVKGLWESVGARVVNLDPGTHDALAARSSHMPHLIAACIAKVAARYKEIGPLAGPGFRDVTRIAASRPEVWRDICLTNREPLLKSLEDLEAEIALFRAALNAGDAQQLETLLKEGGDARREVLEK
jgi:prephenate dehydrogenase